MGLGGDGEVYKNRAFAARTEHIIMQRLCFLPFYFLFIFIYLFLVVRQEQSMVSPALSLILCSHFML